MIFRIRLCYHIGLIKAAGDSCSQVLLYYCLSIYRDIYAHYTYIILTYMYVDTFFSYYTVLIVNDSFSIYKYMKLYFWNMYRNLTQKCFFIPQKYYIDLLYFNSYLSLFKNQRNGICSHVTSECYLHSNIFYVFTIIHVYIQFMVYFDSIVILLQLFPYTVCKLLLRLTINVNFKKFNTMVERIKTTTWYFENRSIPLNFCNHMSIDPNIELLIYIYNKIMVIHIYTIISIKLLYTLKLGYNFVNCRNIIFLLYLTFIFIEIITVLQHYEYKLTLCLIGLLIMCLLINIIHNIITSIFTIYSSIIPLLILMYILSQTIEVIVYSIIYVHVYFPPLNYRHLQPYPLHMVLILQCIRYEQLTCVCMFMFYINAVIIQDTISIFEQYILSLFTVVHHTSVWDNSLLTIRNVSFKHTIRNCLFSLILILRFIVDLIICVLSWVYNKPITMKGTSISVLKNPTYKCLKVYLCPRKHLDLYTCSLNSFNMLPNLNVKSLNGIPLFYIIIPYINRLFSNINYIIKHWTLILYSIPNKNNNWILQLFLCRILFFIVPFILTRNTFILATFIDILVFTVHYVITQIHDTSKKYILFLNYIVHVQRKFIKILKFRFSKHNFSSKTVLLINNDPSMISSLLTPYIEIPFTLYTNYHMNTVVFKYYQQVDVVRYIMISYLKHLHALHIYCSQLAHRYVEKESRRGYCFLHLKFDPP